MARAVHLRRMGGGPPAIEVGHRASDLSVMVIFVAVRLSYVARLARHRCAERFPTSNPCAFFAPFWPDRLRSDRAHPSVLHLYLAL